MISLNVVLVRSKYPRNIGMVSRVLSNFNQHRLILVDPQCDPSDFEAFQGAAEGQTPLRNVKFYKDWDEFYSSEAEGPRIAFSRREGKKRQTTTIDELIELNLIDWQLPSYLIFGAEDHGLSNEDLKLVHRVCHFDLPGKVQSMNLSHAVLYALKTLHSHNMPISKRAPLESSSSISNLEQTLRLWLDTLQIDLKTHTKVNALTVLQQMVLKSTPTNKELHILDSLIHQTVRKLKEKEIEN